MITSDPDARERSGKKRGRAVRPRAPAGENAIAPSLSRGRADPANGAQRAEPKTEAQRAAPEGARSSKRADSPRDAKRTGSGTAGQGTVDLESIPQIVRERFVNLGRKYFLPDGELAFHDHGHKLTTPSENTAIIASLVEIAVARRWEEITVSGTERFRRAAWQHASLATLSVRGYTPTKVEEAQLARTLARRSSMDPELRASQSEHESHPIPASESATLSRSQAAPHRSRSNPQQPRESAAERFLFGELLDHGRENYQCSPHEDLSYFLKLKTDRGQITLWGQDLERALRDSKTQPQIGDRIGVRQVGREAVTVPARERKADGETLREPPLKTYRNSWVVESEAFFSARAEAADLVRNAHILARRATETHPQLVGTYLALGAAEKIAGQRFANPADRARFVTLTREALAQAIARGDPLLSPKLRDRSRTAGQGESQLRGTEQIHVPS